MSNEEKDTITIPTLEPLHDYVLMVPLGKDTQTPSGLWVPERKHDFARWLVLKVGDGTETLKPKDHLEPGFVVLMRSHLGERVNFPGLGQAYTLAKYEQIMAIESRGKLEDAPAQVRLKKKPAAQEARKAS